MRAVSHHRGRSLWAGQGRFGNHRGLAVVVAAFVILAGVYSVSTPIFETPDELQHYAHVNYIARFRWFPPLGAPGEHLWDQQALQAPLFYWGAAAVTFWVDTSDFAGQAVLQPKANIGDATLPGKKNAFLHGPAQDFPYRGTTLAVHICRWVSVLLGAGTVALTYVIAQAVAGPHLPHLGLLAAVVVAFIPQFLFINASCSNDPAIIFTSTLTLALLVRLGGRGATLRWAALFGLAAGLMALSKLIGSVLAAVALAVFAVQVRRWTAVAVAASAFVLCAGWWYARNQILYGDPLALGAFLRFVGGNLDLPPMTVAELWGQFRLLRFSTWGLFGHISVLIQPEWIYLLFDLGAAAGLVAFAAVFIRRLAGSASGGRWADGVLAGVKREWPLIVLMIWLGTILALGARWFAAAGLQGRLIMPGAGAAASLWALGVSALGSRLPPRALTAVFGLPLGAFATAVPPLILWPAYSPPPLVQALPPDAIATAIEFGEDITLRGYTIARDGDLLRLTFYWEAVRQPQTDYLAAIRLVRADGSFWLDYVNYPGMGTSLPTTWRPGELREDELVFDLKRFTAEAQPMRLIVGFYDPGESRMLAVTHGHNHYAEGWALLQTVPGTQSARP